MCSINLKKVGRVLRRIRIEKGISKYRLAGLSGVSEPSIKRLENGECTNMWISKLDSIACGLGVPLAIVLSIAGSTDDNYCRINCDE